MSDVPLLYPALVQNAKDGGGMVVQAMMLELGPHTELGTKLYVSAKDYDALDRDCRKRYDEVAADALRLDAELKAVIQDCRILCNALQRIEAGEAEPRMIARRTLEHWSEKAALISADVATGGDRE